MRFFKGLKTLVVLGMLGGVVLYSGDVAAQGPSAEWDKTLGGSSGEDLLTLEQTADGGYILGGYSLSGISGDKSESSRGGMDYWMVKTDANGNKIWDKTFGGDDDELLYSLQQTLDGGYILGGYSLSGIGGDKTEASRGNNDYWVIKTDAHGNKLWDKTFGGSAADLLFSLQQTADGGYILGGYSFSGISGDKTEASRGFNDYWIVKIDANGNKVWDKTLGGSSAEELHSLQQTTDGGYILGGYSQSGISGDKTEVGRGDKDYWMVKTDANGNKLWDKTFGGNGDDRVFSIRETIDGGYIAGGLSFSGISGDKTEACRGIDDYWIVKTDANGNKLWDKTFGGSSIEVLLSLRQTTDGGYILGGPSSSGISGDRTEASRGSFDYWIVKTDANGALEWDKTLGGSSRDLLRSLEQTTDGGYILGGLSRSGISGDKTEANQGPSDFWIVKLAADKENCEPLSQGYWHRQCKATDEIQHGKSQPPLLQENFEELQAIVDDQLAFSGQTTCQALDADPPKDPCEKALKQYAALLLNLADGKLSDGCETECCGTIGDLKAQAEAAITSGEKKACNQIKSLIGEAIDELESE